MVRLVAGFQPTQDRNRVLTARLADQNGLKTPFQGRVLLDVLAVLIEGGRANAAQFTTRQSRFQEVGRIGPAFRFAGADDGVQLVDEEDDVSVGRLDFFQHGLEAFLKLAPEFGSRDERPHIERDHGVVFQRLRNVRLDDSQREAFRDGGLAHARLADEHRVVLGSAGKDLDHAADLIITADDRVQLAFPGALAKVDPVAFQSGEFGLGVLVRHPLRATQRREGREEFFGRNLRHFQDFLRLGRNHRASQKQVLGRNEFVLHFLGLGLRGLEQILQIAAQAHVAAADLRQGFQIGFGDRADLVLTDAEVLEEHFDDPVIFLKQGREKVQSGDLGILRRGGELLRVRDGFLRFGRKFVYVEHHGLVSLRTLFKTA